MNCNELDPASVWNEFGDYGNRFSAISIWNEFGTYGGSFSQFSPWNPFATSPPIIVDLDGNYYGRFTSNAFQGQTGIGWLVWILDHYDCVKEDFDAAISLYSITTQAKTIGVLEVVNSPSSYGLYTESQLLEASGTSEELLAAARAAGQTDVTSDPSSYSLFTAADVTEAEAEARALGQQDVTSSPSSYNLFTATQVASAEATARTLGQQDVTRSPSTYNLYTSTEYNSARTIGRNDVTSSPSTYNLYTASQYDSARSLGRTDVTSNPSTYNLFTSSQVSSAEATARTVGRNDVTSSPSTYSLYTATQYDSVRTLGHTDVTSSPSTYDLYTSTQLQTEVASARVLGQEDVVAEPSIYNLFTESEVSSAEAAAKTIVNVSARVELGEGESVTPGFVVLGEQKKMLIRAVGPKLADLGVPSPLPNPRMTIYKSRFDGLPPDVIDEIDDWRDATDVDALNAAMASVGAFPLEPTAEFQGRPFLTDDTTSAAALVTLDVGVYTVIVGSADDGAGEVLVEVYEVSE
ncbi:hypothetical protein N8787_02695 [Opitutaceae bacterium]|nr:hypothetical protein [Opitutaceae bacterium]